MLGDGRAFDARQARPAPDGSSLFSVQNSPSLPFFSQSLKPKDKSGSKPPLPPLPGDFGAEFESSFRCSLEARKLRVEVLPKACLTAGTIDRLVEACAEVACDAVVVSVPKLSPDFADWMRRLLYAGFTVLSKRDSWEPSPTAVACVLDLGDRSSASTSGSDDSLTDDDSDASDSDDDDWLDDED